MSLARWCNRNPNLGRLLFVLLATVEIAVAFDLGRLLYTEDLVLPIGMLWVIFGVFSVLALLYPMVRTRLHPLVYQRLRKRQFMYRAGGAACIVGLWMVLGNLSLPLTMKSMAQEPPAAQLSVYRAAGSEDQPKLRQWHENIKKRYHVVLHNSYQRLSKGQRGYPPRSSGSMIISLSVVALVGGLLLSVVGCTFGCSGLVVMGTALLILSSISLAAFLPLLLIGGILLARQKMRL